MSKVTMRPCDILVSQQLVWKFSVLGNILYLYHNIPDLDHDCAVAIEKSDPRTGGRLQRGYFHERRRPRKRRVQNVGWRCMQ